MKIATFLTLAAILASGSILSAADAPSSLPLSPDTRHLTPAAPAAGAFSDTYYVNDHLSTTIATIDARGIIDQIETDAFGAPLPEGRPAVRYTGKPWDDDIGAYVFPFRNYRADEARWMTPDPSGFPDGTNDFRYSATPTKTIDRLGLNAMEFGGTTYCYNTDSGWGISSMLTTGTLTLPISGAPGIYSQIQWVQPASFEQGWIVQQVSADEEIPGITINPNPVTWTEAWCVEPEIQNGGLDTFSILCQDIDNGAANTASGRVPGCAITMIGRAEFIDDPSFSSSISSDIFGWDYASTPEGGNIYYYGLGTPSWFSDTFISHELSVWLE